MKASWLCTYFQPEQSLTKGVQYNYKGEPKMVDKNVGDIGNILKNASWSVVKAANTVYTIMRYFSGG